MLLARYLTRQGQLDEAQRALDQAMAHFRSKAMTPYTANALEVQAEIRKAQGRHDEADQARSEAAALRSGLLLGLPHPAAIAAAQA